MSLQKEGILVVNLGTPKLPEPEYVAAYLKEFLMDPDVIDLPWFVRWFLVNQMIIPKRKYSSSEKYKSIWTENGSPLLYHSEEFTKKLKNKMPEFSIKLAMRYGEPSIRNALSEFSKEGVSSFLLAPLYPQYAEATTGSTVKEVERAIKLYFPKLKYKVLEPFFSNEEFLESWGEEFKKTKDEHPSFDHVLFSFHGLPKRQLKKVCSVECSSNAVVCGHGSANITGGKKNCYKKHSIATAQGLAKKFKLADGTWSISFQSRLGRAEWIKPYTTETVAALAQSGVKKLCIVCPAFTTDCLETLEEINIGERENFLKNGGECFHLLSSLNAEDHWVDSFKKILSSTTSA